MKESVERIQYITDYIVSYKVKIETLNKKGLFDAATLYEIFAQGICEIWFGQKFFNLNSVRANFPYVDLISENSELYVQVSTAKDIPQKVKSTLEKIHENKQGDFEKIKKLYFFVLSNESIDKVRDFTGTSRIGKVEFIKTENLITTDDIIERGKADIEFQKVLYDFLRNENDHLIQIGDKLNEAVATSKMLINTNIDYLINDEYEIDRTENIKKIREDDANFISIQGEAGSGKSALCKKMLENEKLILFARAEKVSECENVEDIWSLNISKAVKYLKRRKLVIYIDALEFIADSAKTKFDLLQQIYETVKGYNNIYIVTTCRSCDRTAFAKIENLYNIRKYEVNLLSDSQIIEIAKKYSIIQDLWETKSYLQLLRSPFYLNLIIKEIKDSKKIDDVDRFRKFIWTDVMCMRGKTLPNGIKYSDIRKTIEKIVFGRAKKFLPGIKREEIDEEIANVLQSESVIIDCGNNRVRLKYDIFEDICFERFIDNKFDDCRSDYDAFFIDLEGLGRCIYRRYQIWVENKLFSKDNREKFLFKLLEADKIPANWKIQTIVGIVKSNFCSEFFEEYGFSISQELLYEFIKLTNTFAFEVRILNLKYENVYSNLKPIGLGRECLINLIQKNGLYKKDKDRQYIFKLCLDYSKSFSYDEITTNSACQILEYFVEERMKETSSQKYYHMAEEINVFLLPIYRMAKYSKEWIKLFWKKRIDNYLNGEGRSYHVDRDIIEYVLKNAVPELAQFLPRELCEIANTYWLKTSQEDKKDFFQYTHSLVNARKYGLSRRADSYRFKYQHIYSNAFINILVKYNPIIALEWIIQLTNHVADSMKTLLPELIYDVSIWETSPENKKTFFANFDYWLVGIQGHRVHELIGDSIFLFTKMAVEKINSKNNNENDVIIFAKYIKSQILKKANNIMMLSMIAEIGRNCEQVIPGYSLFLATSIELVILDGQKMSLLAPDSDRQLYERQILISTGLPGIKDRYNVKMKGNDSLQYYVVKMQLRGEPYREKAENILDYLYSVIPNEGEFAKYNLQIQKMDLRNATMNQVDQYTCTITPKIKGNAKKIVEENSRSKYNIERDIFQKIIEKCNTLMTAENFELQECLNTINQLKSLIEEADVPGQLQNMLVIMIVYVLSKNEITIDERSELCNIWMDGIESIFNNKSFVFEINLVKILFKQIEYEMDTIVKIRLKRQMLNCLFNRGEQGIIYQIACQLKEYLVQNENLAKSIFYTIIEISEDKMSCYKYNAAKLNAIGEMVDYHPNMNIPPTEIKEIFKKKGIVPYQYRYEEIIEERLVQESKKDLENWNLEDCDIQTLCYISGCGLNYENDEFRFVMENMYPYMMYIISSVKDYYEYLNVYAISEVKAFIKKELISSPDIFPLMELLFESPDFSKMNLDTYEFYDDISSYLLAIYFDGYKNADIRRQCEVIIKCTEDKIKHIKDEKIRKRLYTMMFLTLGREHMDDWNAIHTEYSYKDKMFLKDIWSKYGWLHFKNLLNVIEQMHIKALLPEVLIPLNISLRKMKDNLPKYEKIIEDTETIINEIITKAFLDYNDEIKLDKELTKAFEDFLDLLIEIDIEEAAVILDEFRVH